ncbi:MAG: iron-containing alcohol dehydrogenase family protein [Clostridia bacterium]|nr:iron-containing alcohol dehydrogenase family protein [Clostridia bacterium]MEE1024838.1 iron-containing alcohol dehydrogenase family protein [Acutalibacteraceae bacterium]
MENYSMLLPNYSIGKTVYDKIGQYCIRYGSSAVIIGGKTALEKAEYIIKKHMCDAKITVTDTLWYGGEASYENVDILMQTDAVKSADMIFAVGGGKAIDTCKCLADKLNKPIFTFPTISSNCAAITSVSIMYRPDGSFIEPYFFLRPPVHCFINTEIMVEAPYKYLFAGLGDTMAKFYECTISARGDHLEHYTEIGVAMSSMCAEPIIRNGEEAIKSNKNKMLSYAFEQAVLGVVASTGLVSIFLTRDHTPDYNSGLAHAIFYSLTEIPGLEEKHLHGEIVALGLLICLIVDEQYDEYIRLREFYKKVELPTIPEDIDISKEQFCSLINNMCDMSDIRHYPYKVTPQMISDAVEILYDR